MTIACMYCGRSFSRNTNLMRHVTTMHPQAGVPESDSDESDVENDEMEEHQDKDKNESMEADKSDSDDEHSEATLDDQEEESDDQEEEESDDQEEDSDDDKVSDDQGDSDDEADDSDDQDSESETESLTGSGYWNELVCTAAKFVNYKESEDLLQEPRLTKMVDIIRQDVTSRIKFANYMENEDYLIDQIDKAITRHEDDGADPDEAKEAGWIDKRVFIKRKIKKYLPDIEEQEDSSDEENESEQEMEDEQENDSSLEDIVASEFEKDKHAKE